ncbi:unnamed protein product [Linum trigynum]|uniref:Xylanase inhibitor N-terminal domain-containing protein n=1 Tax=Linum trigynum TaxID=586398 RepID=A0AAV2GPX4_9ROSI
MLQPINLVVDLGGPTLWLDCDHHSSSLLQRAFVLSRSILCFAAKSDGLLRRTGGRESACIVGLRNGVVGSRVVGQLAEGDVAVGSTARVEKFIFSCGSAFLLGGLATRTVRMMVRETKLLGLQLVVREKKNASNDYFETSKLQSLSFFYLYQRSES